MSSQETIEFLLAVFFLHTHTHTHCLPISPQDAVTEASWVKLWVFSEDSAAPSLTGTADEAQNV